MWRQREHLNIGLRPAQARRIEFVARGAVWALDDHVAVPWLRGNSMVNGQKSKSTEAVAASSVVHELSVVLAGVQRRGQRRCGGPQVRRVSRGARARVRAAGGQRRQPRPHGRHSQSARRARCRACVRCTTRRTAATVRRCAPASTPPRSASCSTWTAMASSTSRPGQAAAAGDRRRPHRHRLPHRAPRPVHPSSQRQAVRRLAGAHHAQRAGARPELRLQAHSQEGARCASRWNRPAR